MHHLLNLTGPRLAMIVAGVALFFISAFVLWGWRWGSRLERGDRPRFSFPGVGDVSEPTRLLAGLYGMLLAYHLAVWAFPPEVTYMQVPRSRWWIMLLVGAGAIGASLLLDKKEKVAGGSPKSDGDAAEKS